MCQEIDEYMEIDKEGSIRCQKCGYRICRHDQNYKLYCLYKEMEVADIGPLFPDPKKFVDADFVYRQFFCPGCGRLLESEINLKEVPPLWDKQVKFSPEK